MKILLSILMFVIGSGFTYAEDAPSSHAYIYPSDNDAKPFQIYVVVEQIDAVRFLTCTRPGGIDIPHSPSELSNMLTKYCVSDLNPPAATGSVNSVKLFHQKDSDRFVKIDSSINWDASGKHVPKMDLLAFSRNVLFDRKAKNTMNILYTFQDTVDGQNPKVSTMRTTKFNVYDTELPYPAITEKPIEQ